MWAIVKRIAGPLKSRKVRVALVTVIAAYLAEWGVGASEEVVLTIVSVGVALILGIAHEDNGAKSAAKFTELPPAKFATLHSEPSKN